WSPKSRSTRCRASIRGAQVSVKFNVPAAAVVGFSVIAGANPNAISLVIQVGNGGRRTTKDATYRPGTQVDIAAAAFGSATVNDSSVPPPAGAISIGALSIEFVKRAMIPPPLRFSPLKARFVPNCALGSDPAGTISKSSGEGDGTENTPKSP